jgi:hypothetical protein
LVIKLNGNTHISVYIEKYCLFLERISQLQKLFVHLSTRTVLKI